MLDIKTSFVAALALAGALFSGAASAGYVNWSVSVNLPPVATVVSSGGGYGVAPVYYQPAPVYQQPAPVYYQPAPVYQPQVVYRQEPAFVGGYVSYPRPHWEHRHHRHHEWREQRDEYGDRHGGDRWDNEPRRHPH
jgi:hypothetical protein